MKHDLRSPLAVLQQLLGYVDGHTIVYQLLIVALGNQLSQLTQAGHHVMVPGHAVIAQLAGQSQLGSTHINARQHAGDILPWNRDGGIQRQFLQLGQIQGNLNHFCCIHW